MLYQTYQNSLAQRNDKICADAALWISNGVLSKSQRGQVENPGRRNGEPKSYHMAPCVRKGHLSLGIYTESDGQVSAKHS